jgi:tetratricopeptide (TPR) repeat protein
MVQSSDILEKLQRTLPEDVWMSIESAIPDSAANTGRKSQKNTLREINRIIIETAIKRNNAILLNALPEISDEETESLFTQIINQYILTKNDAWFNSIFSLSEKMGKKSNQSRIFAKIARDLIDNGVSRSDSQFIHEGMLVLQKISFRKYRSEIMIDIIPLLIVWAITTKDKQFIHTSLELIEEIGDISKRAVLHSELAKALATIAILEKDRSSFFDSINKATMIHQKNRRHDCLVFIIEKGSRSVFGKEMADVPLFIKNFNELPQEAYFEVIGALTEQMLDRIKDKSQILDTLEILCKNNPSVTEILVLDLLKKAERSGDPWFLSSALNLQGHLPKSETYPIRELVRAGIAVAKNTRDMQILVNLIPIIDGHGDPATQSRIYLQFSEIMLIFDDFNSARVVFEKISREADNTPLYADVLTHLLKRGILKDQIPQLDSSILHICNPKMVNATLARAISELSKETPLEEIVLHIPSLIGILVVHPRKDQILLECITALVDRGFLDTGNPDILIHLAASIRDLSTRERAISLIVIKIAKIGVHARNRDMLQRAVGLTCAIEGQNTRSAALSNIIDEAAILAAQQGDLDLLLRMKVWSSSLLEPDLATFALSNIIDGIIKYAINKQSAGALEEAARIAQEVNDPSLKTQILEKIAEGFVTIGCILLQDPLYLTHENRLSSVLYPFECGMNIIKTNSKSHQISLKIACFIDIILSYSQSSENPDYTIMLALYASEIGNGYEQDAMMARIISCMRDNIPHTGSTDPYEVMANNLFRNDIGKSNPVVLDLLYQIILKISDPFIRFSGMCTLAEAIVKNGNHERARELLEIIYNSTGTLSAEYQKVLILADLAAIYAEIDPKTASDYVNQGILLLDAVEPEKSSEVRRQIVLSIVRVNSVAPDKTWNRIALDVIQKIADPIEYISSLVAVYTMFSHDKEQCADLLNTMASAAEKIPSPYERATTLIDLIPLALQNENRELALTLLEKAEVLSRKINIQYIADIVRENITQFYFVLYQKQKDKQFLDRAIRVIRTIDNDEVRIHHFEQAGLADTSDETARYLKIKQLSEKLLRENPQSGQVSSLEHLVRSIADRGKEALFFCDLAIFFKRAGNGKLSHRMVQSAVKEARIIRPLSRRSHIMCDIALKIYASGSHETAQEILDYAIDAATNIRLASVRDEVFDELGLAIKIMQGL